MHPVTIIVGLVVVLLSVIFAWTGMSVAWGLVMVLAAALIGLVILILILWAISHRPEERRQ